MKEMKACLVSKSITSSLSSSSSPYLAQKGYRCDDVLFMLRECCDVMRVKKGKSRIILKTSKRVIRSGGSPNAFAALKLTIWHCQTITAGSNCSQNSYKLKRETSGHTCNILLEHSKKSLLFRRYWPTFSPIDDHS